tara:strand:+ start:8794 stop:9954 length:1161 start_codon:yes stop_codon:yes gene_type:complete
MKNAKTIDILIIIGSLDTGGTERHLTQVLPRLKQEGIRIAIAAFSRPGELAPLLAAKDVPVLSPKLSKWVEDITPLKFLIKVFWLGWIISSLRPRVVHSFLPEGYLLGTLWAILLRIPLRVMSRRSLNHYQEHHPFLTLLERWLHRKTHALIGNSDAVVEELKREAGPCADRVQLIRNGVDTKRFLQTKPRTQVRSDLGIPETGLLITKVANCIPYKGHRDLLDALHLIADKLPKNWWLACVGRDDGPLQSLQAQAQHLGLSEHILWLGSRQDIPNILSASDIGVLTSHEEGSSNAILEYMAAGLPIIATSVGGNPEIVQDGITGILVPPKTPAPLSSALLTLSKNVSLRKSMGMSGRDRVEECFSIENCVQSYRETYNLLLKNRT